MNKNTMTFEHMVEVAEACQACENLQGVHAILHAAGQTEEEIETMWSKLEDCWWSHNFGGMNSRAAVIRGWANGLAANSRFWYSMLIKEYPEVEGMDPRPLMECAVHMLASSIIEVADDGMSARASWYTPGVLFSTLNWNRKKDGIWIWERYGNDFVKEDGEWKILSQHVCNDNGGPFDGANWAQGAYRNAITPPPPRKPPMNDAGETPPAPVSDVPLYYSGYSPLQTPQNSVPWPEPYETLIRDENSYCMPFAKGPYARSYPIPEFSGMHN